MASSSTVLTTRTTIVGLLIGRENRYEPWLTGPAACHLSKYVSTSYCLLVIALYVALTICKASGSYSKHQHIQSGAFLGYLYLVSSLYILLLLFYFSHPSRSKPNERSHGSAFLRQGAAVFGIGTILYAFLEFATSVQRYRHGCRDIFHSINIFIFMLFITLQMVLIIRYPRLNLRLERGLSHLGLMHLVATNIIIWIRTIYKESMIEFHEAAEEAEEMKHKFNESWSVEHKGKRSLKANNLGPYSELNSTEEFIQSRGEECLLRTGEDSLSIFLEGATPILYPFIIEYVLIGATVFFNTYRHVATPHNSDHDHAIYKPNVKKYVRSLDWSHSAVGGLLGALVFACNIVNLSLFYSFSSYQVEEMISKVTNTAINAVTLVACLQAILKIQFLKDQEDPEAGVNSFLLLLSGFFLLIYSSLEVIVGVLEESAERRVRSMLQMSNGVLSIAACLSQIIFMQLIMRKALEPEDEGEKAAEASKTNGSEGTMGSTSSLASSTPTVHASKFRALMERYRNRVNGMPGRQETVFLFLLNLSQWLIFTFEQQKRQASRSEAEFFGVYTWVILQRILFPLCIFYRFHCAVIMIECWKNNYRKKEM